ncbi:MAG TPA: hypothetical protein ENJ87_00260 [Gammaproteobacteria bacterium]|nr:hypothetical protein [Gammaproteobacteria bacterium]
MTDNKKITEAQLHAYIDHELCDTEQTEVLKSINDDPELLKTVNEIKYDMDMLSMAYRNLPVDKSIKNSARTRKSFSKNYAAIAASIILSIGMLSGWFIASESEKNITPIFTVVDDFDPVNLNIKKILVHINTMDKYEVSNALNKIETILATSEEAHTDIRLELVASIKGLALLRQGSPYAEKITSLSNRYDNVKFLACGVAMEATRIKEDGEVILLPEAKKIPAAIDEILEKLEEGWTYARL